MEFASSSSADSAPPHSLFPLFADKHKDGTAILLELEKGLRSTKIGEQCESIAFFARLIVQHPFVVVVNTAVLKLADLFRQSNNFVRLCIVRVFQSCEEQLIPGNILNLDEILRRLTAVLHSNDPIARALTLRLLSPLSPLIADRLDIQHWIRKCFDSQHGLETDATLALMDRVAARSESFCMAMLAKASETIDALESPMSTKLRLMHLFRHMHHSATLAHEVEARCTALLAVHTLRAPTVALLESLTALAERVPGLAARHVARLWTVATADSRRAVQERALLCLARLAARPRGVFSVSTADLWQLIEASPYDAIRRAASLVLKALASSAPDEFFKLADVARYCPLLQTAKSDVSAALAHVLAMVATHPALAAAAPEEAAHAADALAGHLCLLIALRSALPGAALPFAPLVRLARLQPACRASVLRAILPLVVSSPSPAVPAAARVAALVASIDPSAAAQVAAHAPALLDALRRTGSPATTLSLCELLLRALPPPASLAASILPSVSRSGGWATYTLGRAALCGGAPALAADAFRDVSERVATELYHAWLRALRDLARAEVHAHSAQGLPAAQTALGAALAELQGAATPAAPLLFQTKFVACRRAFLAAVASLRLLLHEVPRPPVILYTLRDARVRAVADRIASARRVFADLAAEVALLSHSHFDIDPASAAALQTHANVCHTLAALVRLWFDSADASAAAASGAPAPSGHLPLDVLCAHLLAEAPKVGADLSTRADAMLEAVQLLLAQTPPYPRFFFRGSPGTTLKLSVAPRPHSHSEALLVQSSVTVVLRISGVLHLAPHVRRHAQRVSVVVRVTEVAQGLKLKNLRLDQIRGNEVAQHTLRIRLRNQAFSTSCLLRFPVPARTYLVSMQPALVSAGEEWPVPPDALFVRTADAPAVTPAPTAPTAAAATTAASATASDKK